MKYDFLFKKINEVKQIISGHVGPPLPCSMIKLINVPELDYDVRRDHIGEVCVKGTNIFKGYYKNREKTKEVLDEETWLRTGDIGTWNSVCFHEVSKKIS